MYSSSPFSAALFVLPQFVYFAFCLVLLAGDHGRDYVEVIRSVHRSSSLVDSNKFFRLLAFLPISIGSSFIKTGDLSLNSENLGFQRTLKPSFH